jgi:hypothetical protein
MQQAHIPAIRPSKGWALLEQSWRLKRCVFYVISGRSKFLCGRAPHPVQGVIKGRLLQARLRSRGQPRQPRRQAKLAVSTAAHRAEAAAGRATGSLGLYICGDEALVCMQG